MKKIELIILSVFTLNVFTNHLVSAQHVSFGIKGGLNRSSINDENRVQDSKVTPRLGFHVGGLAHIHLNDKWAVQPELMYSKEGANYEATGYTGKTNINYVNLPILIQYMFGPGFRVETGPQFGLLAGANYEDTNNKETRKTDIQNGNVAWAFGLGYLTKMGIGLDARFNLGLSNIYPRDVHPGQSARTRVGQFGLFYQFKH